MHQISPFLAVALLLASSLPAHATPTTTQLPRSVRPTHYDVTIAPDAEALRFAGKVAISIHVTTATRAITLNALDLTLSNATLSQGAKTWNPTGIKIDEPLQTATLNFERVLPRGNYRLVLDYTGRIATQATGLFAIDYAQADGRKRALYTKFEASDARRMIPSWDEPAFKTTFNFEAIVPTRLMAISNMPVAERAELPNGRVRVRFATTPKMSTYLLFFGLGEFDRATTMQDDVELGVVTRKGSVDQAAYVLESSRAVLKSYHDFFGVRYPLPKLDNVAAPGRSQSFSAMENWGAIFSFEHSLLLDPTISSQSDKQRAFGIAAHEISHQWFGNLVTMAWWDDLWLNEGFATWMTGRATEWLHPEWNGRLSSIATREWAMEQDALETSHPVVQHVETVDQVSQAFDGITYQKGAAVIGMLEDYVGADAWRNGVRRYTRKHAYGNATSADLWKQIEGAARKPVRAIARDFTEQPGMPLIRLESATCAQQKTSVKLAQGEFSRDHPDKKPLRWQVPVIVQQVGSPTIHKTLVSHGKASLVLPGCAPVVVNAGRSGYFRTLYPADHFTQLASSFASLNPIDQLGLLSDSWSLGMTGLHSSTHFLDLAMATPLSADPKVWGKIASLFATLDRLYATNPKGQTAFRQFASHRLTPVLAQLGWAARPGEPETLPILRNQLIETLGALGDPTVIGEARRRYATQANDPAALPTSLRRTVLGVVAAHADAQTWEQLHATALAERTPLIRDQLFQLLASSADPDLARKALVLSLTAAPGETGSAGMIRRVAALHPDMAFDFTLENLNTVNGKVDKVSLSRFIPSLARTSLDPAMSGKLNSYAEQHLAPGARRELKATIANIAYWVKAGRERLPLIDAWLAAHAA